MFRRVLACAATAVALLAALALPASAAEATTTFVTMVSESGDYIGAGATRLFSPAVAGTSVSLSGTPTRSPAGSW